MLFHAVYDLMEVNVRIVFRNVCMSIECEYCNNATTCVHLSPSIPVHTYYWVV